MGNLFPWRSSTTRTPGAWLSTSRASDSVTGRSNSAWMDSLWALNTGTRTHVALMASWGAPRILRDSRANLRSSVL